VVELDDEDVVVVELEDDSSVVVSSYFMAWESLSLCLNFKWCLSLYLWRCLAEWYLANVAVMLNKSTKRIINFINFI
jgi:hypothetical protein